METFINSSTMNSEVVEKVGNIFKEEFDSLDFETGPIENEPFNRAGLLMYRSIQPN
ncbi:MAG: hypothetical protein JKY88_09810 [Pseudomonadales bacterium]|nr:hypothetical protein [Pseudomonadales bacterium]